MRKFVGLVIILTLGLSLALPADAVSCSSATQFGFVFGTTLRSLTTTSCTGGNVTLHRARVQEKVGFVWNTNAERLEFPNTASDQVQVDYDCAGHGTDTWRGQGYAEDSGGGNYTTYDPSSSGTSLTC